MLDNFLEDEYEPYNQVYSHESGYKLFLGDVTAAVDIAIIQRQNIGFVVTAAVDMEHVKFQSHIKHIRFNVFDSKTENLSKLFEKFSDLTENELKRTNVLVHCFAGVSRSATLVLAYLMKKNNWTFREAISEVRRYRPKVLPNLGFQRQLKQFEKKIFVSETNQERKHVSKTSQSKKHVLKQKSIGLPELFGLGNTITRSKMIQHVEDRPDYSPITPADNRRGAFKASSKSPSKIEYFRLPRSKMIEHFQDNPDHGIVAPAQPIKPAFRNLQQSPSKNEHFPIAYTEPLQTKRLPLRSFRKRSISTNKNQLKSKPELDLYSRNGNRSNMRTVFGQKINLNEMKFATEKNIRHIALREYNFGN